MWAFLRSINLYFLLYNNFFVFYFDKMKEGGGISLKIKMLKRAGYGEGKTYRKRQGGRDEEDDLKKRHTDRIEAMQEER